METLILLIHGYFVVAILYNVFSQIFDDVGGKKWAPTDPSYGFQVVSLVYVIFLIRDLIPEPAFLFLFGLWTLSILRFGVGNHLKTYSKEGYFHRLTWVLAIAINVFGVSVFTALFLLRGAALLGA